MDADYDALEQKKIELLTQLADLEVQQQQQRRRRKGMPKKVPHFSEIEDAGHKLGTLLSRVTQTRFAKEVVSGDELNRDCPDCE
jgi:hypothetical protein